MVRRAFAAITLLGTIWLLLVVEQPGSDAGQILAGLGAGSCATLFVHLIVAEARSDRKRADR